MRPAGTWREIRLPLSAVPTPSGLSPTGMPVLSWKKNCPVTAVPEKGLVTRPDRTGLAGS